MIPRSSRPLRSAGYLAAFLTMGTIAFILTRAVIAPWGFYLGGTFHVLPIWEGCGKLHAPSGDFSVFISMYPATGGGRGTPGLSGTAALCTPRGERFRLKLTGGMHSKHVGLNTDGEPMTLHLYSRPYWYLVSAAPEQPPRIELYGKWSNPDLILDDRGSFASAFMADGTLYRGKDHSHSAGGEPLQIRLAPGTRSDFDASCLRVASER